MKLSSSHVLFTKLFVLATLCGISGLTVRSLNTRIRTEAQSNIDAAEAAIFVDNYATTGNVISSYRSSCQTYALSFGNTFAGYRYTSELRQLYPHYFDYNQWGDVLSRFGYSSSVEDIQALTSSTLIHGTDINQEMLLKVLKHLTPSTTAVALPDKASEHFYLLRFEPSNIK